MQHESLVQILILLASLALTAQAPPSSADTRLQISVLGGAGPDQDGNGGENYFETVFSSGQSL